MNDLISRNKLQQNRPEWLNENCVGREEHNNGWNACNEMWLKTIAEQPTVEAVPKSYVDQIRWERDIAVEQLNEIGCQFGQKMDEVKKKLEASQWILCSERLPEENRDGWTELLLSIKTGEVILGFWHDIETGFCRRFRDGVCRTGGVIAWQPLPEPYKGE